MSWKTILAVLPDRDAAARTLNVAVPLARRLGAHLIGLHTTPMPVAWASPLGFPDTTMLESALELYRAKASEVEKLFRDRVALDGVSAEWRGMESFSGDNGVASLTSARAADLVVAPQADPSSTAPDMTSLEALLFESGRPVLFVPFAGEPPARIAKVLIGWNGTREAARAVFDALPLIKEADTVEVLTVDAPDTHDQSAGMAGAEIAATLARHGIKVTAVPEHSAGIPVSAVISNRVADTGVDLVVLGAFSHRRLTELLFGGVTRSILSGMPGLTLMSR